MMPNFGNWYAEIRLTVVDAETRAALCWKRIQDRPTSITINRSGVGDLAAQTVRIEYGESANPTRSDVTGATTRDVWVIGVKDHPSVADTNIKRSDRFALAKQTYVVMDVIEVPGEVQARCERVV